MSSKCTFRHSEKHMLQNAKGCARMMQCEQASLASFLLHVFFKRAEALFRCSMANSASSKFPTPGMLLHMSSNLLKTPVSENGASGPRGTNYLGSCSSSQCKFKVLGVGFKAKSCSVLEYVSPIVVRDPLDGSLQFLEDMLEQKPLKNPHRQFGCLFSTAVRESGSTYTAPGKKTCLDKPQNK